MERAETVIIGAGFAGASTAYHLARRGAADIVVAEKEETPGLHSSGRNAALARQLIENESIASLAVRGVSFLRRPPDDWPTKELLEANGSLLLLSKGSMHPLQVAARKAPVLGLWVESISRDRAVKMVPVIETADFDEAMWCPSDGVADIHGLLQGFLRGATDAGARLWTACEVTSIRRDGPGRNGGFVVETGRGRIRAARVVNASGGWAGAVGEMAGATPIRFRPLRRHLFSSPPLDWVVPRWPFVWDVTREFYFRPESGGLLLSPCDESEVPPSLPDTDPEALELLASKLERHMPSIADVPIARSWAGLRTFSPDRNFVIGQDPNLEGFFWVAGLGGHGMTVSPVVGSLAADWILGCAGGDDAAAFTPERFA